MLAWTAAASRQASLRRHQAQLLPRQTRAASVERANRSITEDPAVMGGVPVFAGTRVPIEIVTSSKAAGIGDDRLREAYSFLTSELIQDAEVYQQVHPRHGRPRKLADANPTWKVQSEQLILHSCSEVSILYRHEKGLSDQRIRKAHRTGSQYGAPLGARR
ncbi:DUF433 domain-containing protein, partial [Cupriavidus sp. CuC1]|uniref:DUF433 domain-containing protein n=1 Tax=Cupriavidus sp. CuC1 TaxID=3373131 RepID=UPI0037D53944